MRQHTVVLCAALWSGSALAQSLNCDLKDYKPADGLKAEVRGDALNIEWRGERNEQLRAVFAIRDGQPLVRELAARKNGAWVRVCPIG